MRTKRDISNSQDIIDSRDIIARITELEEMQDDAKADAERILETRGEAEKESTEQDEIYGKETAQDGTEYYTSVDFGEEEYEELKTLLALQEEASNSADWTHGEALIRDTYFQEYAEQLADDIGAIDRNASWPVNCIDWEQAAEELKQDYTSVEFGEETYWIRS